MRVRNLAAVVVAVACLAGCGNGSESSAASSAPSVAPSPVASPATVRASPTTSFTAGMTSPGTILKIGEWATYAEDQDDPVDVARVRVARVDPVDAALVPGAAPDTTSKFYAAVIQWGIVRGNPDQPYDAQELLGLDWVRRSAAAESGQRFADDNTWPDCGTVAPDVTTTRLSCVLVYTSNDGWPDATLGFAFRLTLGDVADANRHIFWTAPQWEQNRDLGVSDACAQGAFANVATPGTAAVPFCDGRWALLRFSHSGEGDAPTLVVRRSEAGSWVLYTSFPTAICVDQFRAEGGPKDLESSFPPCQ